MKSAHDLLVPALEGGLNGPTKHVETDYFYVGKNGETAFEDSKPHHERDEVGPTK